MTLASWITLTRCLGGPLVAYLVQFPQQRTLAAGLFAAFAATDWLDGFIARRTKTITDLGKFLDPFADKVLVLSALLAMVYMKLLPFWGMFLILMRELSVQALRLAIVEKKKKMLAASWPAKWKTVFQMAAVIMILMKWPYGLEVFWFAVVLTVYSFAEYVWVNRKVFKST